METGVRWKPKRDGSTSEMEAGERWTETEVSDGSHSEIHVKVFKDKSKVWGGF